MAYIQKYQPSDIKDSKCPKCGYNLFLYKGSTVICKNCNTEIGKRFNKFGAVKTEFNGRRYDSKFEASGAVELDLRKRVGDILDYDPQFKVEMWAYREDGVKAFKVSHKIDFRVHELDGIYTLQEYKGKETADYKMRRKFLENIWLPLHKDYKYEVIKQ